MLDLCCCASDSLAEARGNYYLAMVHGLLVVVASLAGEHAGSRVSQLQELWLLGCGARPQLLCHLDLVVPRHVASPQIRD